MIRFPLSMAMLALCLVALQCTASDPGLGDDDNTRDNGRSGGSGGGSGDPGPQDKPASTERTQASDAEQQEQEQAASLAVTTTTAENKASGPTGDIDTDSPAAGTEKSGSEHSSTSSSSSSSSVANKTAAAAGPASPPSDVGKAPGVPLITDRDSQSGVHSSSGTLSGRPTGDNHDGSHTAERHAVTTDVNNKGIGTGSSAGSANKTPTVGSEANTPLASSGVPLSPSLPSIIGAGSSSTQSGHARDTGDGITDSASHKTADINKDRSQDNGGNQAKTDVSQKQGNTGSSPTSSAHTGANKQAQEQNISPASKLQKQTEEDTSTSEDVHQNGATTNNNKRQTHGQGNAGIPMDPKTVINVPSNKGATKTPKPDPSLTTGTESKMNSTITTAMEEDVQSTSDANETLKTPTSTLAKQTKTLEQLQTLNKNDGSSRTSLIFAFATLVTLAMVSVTSVS